MARALSILIAIYSVVSCEISRPTATPVFHESENPTLLSDWGMIVVQGNNLRLSAGVKPYDLATPLFSDYALKLRTIWTSGGRAAQYSADQTFDFPVGTVISKTFYYPSAGPEWDGAVTHGATPGLEKYTMRLDGLRLMETRLLVRREAGWVALPYVWNDGQTDAVLKRTGDIKLLILERKDGRRENFPYVIPNANQCAGCHATNATTKAIEPIGPKARHLNKDSSFAEGVNQLDHWIAINLLEGDFSGSATAPRNALWDDEAEDLDHRARSYLDVNCSHCHNPNGAGDTSGLNLEPNASGPALGFYKTPVAAGSGTGGRPYDIAPGHPDASITLFRMETTDPGAMMPELGRAVAHEEGIALIRAWIEQLDDGDR